MPAPTSGYLPRLYSEWDRELADHPTADHDGVLWADRAPALAGISTLGAVLEMIDAGDTERTDAVLHALLTLASRGSDIAARTVLQAMLPAVRRQGHTARFRRLEDPLSCAGAAMWTAISTYPLRRTRRVAANLALEALRALDAQEIAPLPIEDVEARVDAAHIRTAGHGGPEVTDAEAAAATIAWGMDHGILTPEDGRLLALVHLAEPTPSTVELADEFGITAAAVRQRHSRAVRRLASAVRDRLGCPSPEDLVATQATSQSGARRVRVD